MRRHAKVKPLTPRTMIRKSALSASAAARRGFPAWIDASERVAAFPAVGATQRVRDALVLRLVAKRKSAKSKDTLNANGVR